MSYNILIVDDEKSFREFLEILFINEGFKVFSAKNLESATRIIQKENIDIVLCDLVLGGEDGLDLARFCFENHKNIPFILMTAYASDETALKSVELGVIDYITKPFDTDELLDLIKAVLKKDKVDNHECCKELDDIIGLSESVLKVKSEIINVAPSDATVLITGESGTGKELVARAIHKMSDRKDNPFIPINCSAIPSDLLESELFGYKKGAFTGANNDKIGIFEAANNGTIFLDEIGEMPLFLQAKLLRVLQEGVIRPIGSNREIKVNTRVIAATNKNLINEVKEGRFREDLFYRLNVINIHLPPLRERLEDLLLLVNYFIKKYSEKFNKQVSDISFAAMRMLENYSFPGNIRELENIIERAVLIERTNKILPSSIDIKITDEVKTEEVEIPENFSLDKYIENIEKKYIKKALMLTNGNQSRAAKKLGISLRSLRYKIEKYEIR
ncbi:sigma-54-dependent Fis family transcriptional regulator [Deferribacter autotrophicus]|uniref:Sigma-54-dependent Fis family transcriptional regulator n=1 Tax=Deferribacter autotrophicus TaxID=500465 RepID=A0A5A8F7E7_9BACT|nr:sigma-54 dependent transcriptional regulator [Deferribacter autotrophicus]KAA0259319.1 sigma-54-dependent Fis family transcriptional regulator [Deferribacter autotrophicus]